MISDRMADLLNRQMNREFFNSHLYLSMATYFYDINLDGFAHWMEKQAEEETEHAMRLYAQLQERGARIKVGCVEAPPLEWSSPLAAFEDAYAHECKVSGEFDRAGRGGLALKTMPHSISCSGSWKSRWRRRPRLTRWCRSLKWRAIRPVPC